MAASTTVNGSPAGAETVDPPNAGGSAGAAGDASGSAETARRQRASRGGDPTKCRAQRNRRAKE